ncbi:hypothetical protein GOP47_0007044 [Adiantum capillus-veneris]|uniref:ABC transporter domain-containing protein n=1 Tax=Adiantum capillus-veneris TaxID=13818 RepID=A0A9D4UZY5_ADICA|nr:hypothetical protein GOP47_0007044 [Adiantum capillus-veneris]
MIMLAKALEYANFDRVRVTKIHYAGMLQYDGELKLPSKYLVSPPKIDRTLGEYFAKKGLRTFACSKTVKFGPVTFFWNGNRSSLVDSKLETYVEIQSDQESTLLELQLVCKFKPEKSTLIHGLCCSIAFFLCLFDLPIGSLSMKQQIQLSRGQYQRVDKQVEQEFEEVLEDEHLVHIPEGGPLTGNKAPKISIKDLNRFTDAGDLILSLASLDIYAGTVVGIIGPSGSGKSTLLRALNRLWEPPPDTVFLDAQDITKLDVISVRRRVGMLFQLPALFDGTIADNLNYGPSLKGERLSHDRLVELLRYADLDSSFLSKSITGLSVGMEKFLNCLVERMSQQLWITRATCSNWTVFYRA